MITHKVGAQRINHCISLMRGLFQVPTVFKAFGVTRSDVIQGTETGKQALETLGKVPEDILYRKKRPQPAPEIRNPSDIH